MNLRKLAKGKPCMLRIPYVCNHNPETTVLCHLNGWGMSGKHPDLLAAWGCSDCHSWVDRDYAKFHTKEQRDFLHLEGIIRTQQELLKMGLAEVIEEWKA